MTKFAALSGAVWLMIDVVTSPSPFNPCAFIGDITGVPVALMYNIFTGR
jgi:hypothetical protein